MDFEWYEPRSARNDGERGLPFEPAADLFAAPTLEWEDRRRDWGERRMVAVGRLGDRYVTCIDTWRGTEERPVRRIIPLRRARRKEIDGYRQAYPEADQGVVRRR